MNQLKSIWVCFLLIPLNVPMILQREFQIWRYSSTRSLEFLQVSNLILYGPVDWEPCSFMIDQVLMWFLSNTSTIGFFSKVPQNRGENYDRHWKMMKFSFYCNIPLLCDKTSFTALPGHMSCHIFGALAHFCKTMHKTLLTK